MSLHQDKFFKKNKNVLVKSAYVTAMHRCNQDMKTRLKIAVAVLKVYKKDGSDVSMQAVIMGV